MSNLDLTLDDLIKMNKTSGSTPRNPRLPAGISGHGPTRRFHNRYRSTPYISDGVQAPETRWDHDMFARHVASYPARPSWAPAIETGTKLLISNLYYGVSDEDIKELFAEVGDLKRSAVHYDKSGRSKGTAEVVYARWKDAEAAVKRYNHVELDGMPMKVEIVGRNLTVPSIVHLPTDVHKTQNAASRRHRGSLGRPGEDSYRRISPHRRGKVDEKLSAEDLDAELDKYHAEAKQPTK